MRKEKLAVLGQVAGSVGHELRNPLGVMNNAVYFLQTVLSDADDTVKEYLGMIKTEIVAADRIVSDLLDSVRTKPPQPEAVGVGGFDQPDPAQAHRSRHRCRPAWTSRQRFRRLQVDPLQVQQVFRNLISNGIDAMAEGGTLEIRATEGEPKERPLPSACGIPAAALRRSRWRGCSSPCSPPRRGASAWGWWW